MCVDLTKERVVELLVAFDCEVSGNRYLVQLIFGGKSKLRDVLPGQMRLGSLGPRYLLSNFPGTVVLFFGEHALHLSTWCVHGWLRPFLIHTRFYLCFNLIL